MFTPRISQALALGLLLLIPGACSTTKSSIRSELERADDRQAGRLTARRDQGEQQRPRVTSPAPTTTAGITQKIHRRPEWGARPHKASRLNVVGGRWEKITVHHSDEVGATIFNGSFSQSAQAIRSIQRHHLDGNGWGDIGYHFLIDARGRIFEGRELAWQGAHAGNSQKNRRNIGICLLGDFNHGAPSTAACTALKGLLDDLRRVNSISLTKVLLHSDLSNTECPGKHLAAWVKSYRGS